MPFDLRVPLPGLVRRLSGTPGAAPLRAGRGSARRIAGSWRRCGPRWAPGGGSTRRPSAPACAACRASWARGAGGEGLMQALAAVAEAARRSLAWRPTTPSSAPALAIRRAGVWPRWPPGEVKRSPRPSLPPSAPGGHAGPRADRQRLSGRRDATRLAPFYARPRAAGAVRVGRAGWARPGGGRPGASVCYVTARELVFDYLRDGQRRGFAGRPAAAGGRSRRCGGPCAAAAGAVHGGGG